ncbi:LacI family transcriptional regulator [Brachyspira hyodysenteriae]|uniref:substrate-binding domain-containing protein n=1 Tax=Brachyspira hyodysenteriae TaxID=159 RepID=UPI0022CDBA22|nr:LacI family DNA-binding transcriptional regulator [Brachyspira hyodysenteriae]MCZ9839011.1 LacI family transcriptional regulator [Brachyspira hyodysenteriae]MCZ9847630.1 LacI family transcriptional regulator [Brachyspira hyodysenteriae]MCZ9851479.1 LacI family transcriptional regulator [Brachyspira hyodysenteriae]MCZ9859794.1 LacI family transcriptional regulator [Brachyspira hyodysenteriae]MCZ9870990.1 LacI family transcriptional regulator [Brachyspira hyodysenteriae]
MNDNVKELKSLKRVTQKEIAKRLGISRTTVARAINGSEFIKEETKSKILELASELNYEKNYIGSSLANQKEKVVYCLIADSFNEFYTKEIIRGLNTVQKEYSVYNYNLKIIPTEIHSPDKQVETLKNILKEDNIDGLIITPLNRDIIHNILKPYFGKINIISIGTRLSENIPHVGPNHIKQGSIVAGIVSNLLRDNEKLLIIDNGDDNISSGMYLEGFLQRIKDTNIDIIGPIYCGNIEDSIHTIKKICYKEDIKGIYINRYAQEIYDMIDKNILKGKKIVTHGMAESIKNLIKSGIISFTVMEGVFMEGYNAGKIMFEMIYKKNVSVNWEISDSKIIFLENLQN